jgi:Cu(I)/Ag(I) efflux system protein CusF
MNRTASILLLVLIAVLFASCQKQNIETKSASPVPQPTSLAGPPGFPMPVLNKPYPGTGVVGTINRQEGWIELNHEEIKDLMPAMQMEFNVKDKTLLDKVKTGDRVDFTIVETEKGEWLTEIKKIPAP